MGTLTYVFAITEDRSSLLESAKKVGAQSPTNIPKRSACALASADSPPVKNQMAIEPIMETNPSTKQRIERFLNSEEFMCSTFAKWITHYINIWNVTEMLGPKTMISTAPWVRCPLQLCFLYLQVFLCLTNGASKHLSITEQP